MRHTIITDWERSDPPVFPVWEESFYTREHRTSLDGLTYELEYETWPPGYRMELRRTTGNVSTIICARSFLRYDRMWAELQWFLEYLESYLTEEML